MTGGERPEFERAEHGRTDRYAPLDRAPLPVPWALPDLTVATAGHRVGGIAAAVAVSASRVAANRLLRRHKPQDIAVEVNRAFQALGATFAKLGQIVAATPGMFGEPVSDVFRASLDAGPPLPAAVVRAAIEADLRHPMDRLFASFDPEPIGRASIAVVHRAVTYDGRAVAIKVLRPGIEDRIATDLGLVLPICRFVADHTGSQIAGALETAMLGLRQQLAEELDLRNEAATLDHQRTMLTAHGLTYLTVPATVPQLCGRRVLTMDLLDGVPVDDASAIASFGHDPEPRVLELIRHWFTSVIRDGMFHGDIHAGNLLLLRDGRLALIDWGILGRLDDAPYTFFRRMFEGVMGDATAWEEMTKLLEQVYGPALTESMGVAPEELADLFEAIITPSFVTPFGEMSMADTIARFGTDSTLLNPNAAGSRSLLNRVQSLRRNRRLRRMANAEGTADSAFNHGMMLVAKQMMFFDRYGHLYLEHTSLLDDRDYYVDLLAEGRPA